MADGFDIKITGLEELKATFESLATKDADACLMKALKAGSVIEQAAIEAAAPVKSEATGGRLPAGALKADIEITTHRPKNGSAYITVGPGKYTAAVARFVEYGHRLVRGGHSKVLKSGKTRGLGKEIGEVEPHPFVRPAYEESREAVADAIATTLITSIEAAAAKQGK